MTDLTAFVSGDAGDGVGRLECTAVFAVCVLVTFLSVHFLGNDSGHWHVALLEGGTREER